MAIPQQIFESEKQKAQFYRIKEKWKLRRRFAIFAFIQLAVLTGFYCLAPFFMNAGDSQKFSDFTPIIITLIGFFSTIVMLYIGAETYSEQNSGGIITHSVTAALDKESDTQ